MTQSVFKGQIEFLNFEVNHTALLSTQILTILLDYLFSLSLTKHSKQGQIS
jgi:hypothetical protein